MTRFLNKEQIDEFGRIVDQQLASNNPPEFLKEVMTATTRLAGELTSAYRRFRHRFKRATGWETDYRIIVEHPDLGGFVLDATGQHPFGPGFTTDAATEPSRNSCANGEP